MISLPSSLVNGETEVELGSGEIFGRDTKELAQTRENGFNESDKWDSTRAYGIEWLDECVYFRTLHMVNLPDVRG